MIRCFVISSLIAGVISARVARAESDRVKSVTVEEVIEQAMRQSPVVRAIDADRATAQAEGIALETLENPQLDGEYRLPTSNAGRARANEASASLSQPLRVSYFGARQRVNKLIQQSASSDRALAVLALSQEIRLLYMKGWVFTERELQLERMKKKTGEVSRFVEQAIDRGLFGKGEGAVFRAEERKLAADLIGVQADLERVRAEFSRKTGFRQVGFVRPVWTIIEVPSDVASVSLPIQQRAQLRKALAEEQGKLAELDRFPRFSPRLVYSRTNDGFDYAGIGISVELPVFDSNRAERHRREAEASAARARNAYLLSDTFRDELGSLKRSAIASFEQAQIYEQDVVPKLEEGLKTYDARLRAGQAALPQVWQTFQALSNARATSLELLVEAASRRAELSVLVGQDL